MTTNTDGIAQASAAPLPADPITSFFSTILEPGSSLHPTFLLIVDGAFLFLVLTLLSLAFVTSGNIHILALTVLSLGLWGSVKWCAANPRFGSLS